MSDIQSVFFSIYRVFHRNLLTGSIQGPGGLYKEFQPGTQLLV